MCIRDSHPTRRGWRLSRVGEPPLRRGRSPPHQRTPRGASRIERGYEVGLRARSRKAETSGSVTSGAGPWMGRLVEAGLGAVGEGDGRQATPCLFGDRLGQRHALHLKGRNRGIEVVAEQVDLVPGRVGGVNGEFCGWQGEDEPAVTGVYVRQTERVPEEGSERLRGRAEDDGVDPV